MIGESEKAKVVSFVKRELSKKGARLISLCISGSHLGGYNSVDSDVDYRGVFIFNTKEILGLKKPKGVIELKIGNGDIVLIEVEKAIGLAIKGNGNVLEHLSAPQIYSTREHIKLKRLFNILPKNGIYNHYRGMAYNNYRQFIVSKKKLSVKIYLYILGSLMRGIYALQTGKIEPNILKLDSHLHVSGVADLVERKRDGTEEVLLPEDTSYKALETTIHMLFEQIEKAYSESALPDEMPDENIVEIDRFLKRARKKFW